MKKTDGWRKWHCLNTLIKACMNECTSGRKHTGIGSLIAARWGQFIVVEKKFLSHTGGEERRRRSGLCFSESPINMQYEPTGLTLTEEPYIEGDLNNILVISLVDGGKKDGNSKVYGKLCCLGCSKS